VQGWVNFFHQSIAPTELNPGDFYCSSFRTVLMQFFGGNLQVFFNFLTRYMTFSVGEATKFKRDEVEFFEPRRADIFIEK